MLRVRRLLCLGASLLAFAALLIAATDSAFQSWSVLLVSLGAMSASALVLAVLPSTADWTRGRRAIALIVAALWIPAGIPVFSYAIAEPACACLYGRSTVIGATGPQIALVAAAGGLTMLFAAAVLPRRRPAVSV